MFLRGLSIALLCIALLVAFSASEESPFAVGDHLPHFTLQDLEGNTWRSEDLHGHVVLLNVWATTCGSCAAEMPALNRLHTQYKARGVSVLGLNEDGPRRYAVPQIERYLERIPIEFPILLDGDGQVANQLGTFRIPETYIIDQQGNFVEKIVGEISYDDESLHETLQLLLEDGDAP